MIRGRINMAEWYFSERKRQKTGITSLHKYFLLFSRFLSFFSFARIIRAVSYHPITLKKKLLVKKKTAFFTRLIKLKK